MLAMWPNLTEGIISFQNENKQKTLFTDFVIINKLLSFFDQSKSIAVHKIKIQKGIGKTYEFYDHNSLPRLNSIEELVYTVKKLGNGDLEFFHLEFDIENDFNVLIYENSLYLTFLKNTENNASEFVLKLLLEIEKFEFDTAYELLRTLMENPNKIIKIDSYGTILKFYRDMDEYRKG